MINKAMLTIRFNSSYVLIIITTFRQDFGMGESTSPGCPVKHTIQLFLLKCVYNLLKTGYNILNKTADKGG
ncbi:hypothetical protein BRYFOR_05409 [Marvinbryantia formatexigens DSM 14469]|uniref:Uncharacterized protein n=1 Tax=Marvinbryantia formatexigens DSM 14469 TaxID=478749 RepID=C6L9W7_9FIRM|nr:hypothetical protein BRYFOR_05409 [Marvinbryantia formatexigens DSM 14469]